MNTLILVSKTPIVIQIFNLICKKLYISLEVVSDAQIDHKVDMIIIDTNMIDERFNILKTYCKLIGAISNEELPFEMANDFLIPSPFLPSTLEVILQKQLQELIKRANAKTYVTNVEEPISLDNAPTINQNSDNEVDPAVEYIESLASNIANDIKNDIDDSIVHTSSIEGIEGGILDHNELSKLEDIIDVNTPTMQDITEDYDPDKNSDNSDEWMDLSSIIDKAIDEVNSTNDLYDKLENKPIKLLLNNYSMNELKPLFELLNQEIIDALADGQEITLQLKLGNENG